MAYRYFAQYITCRPIYSLQNWIVDQVSYSFNDCGGNVVNSCFLKHADICGSVFPADVREFSEAYLVIFQAPRSAIGHPGHYTMCHINTRQYIVYIRLALTMYGVLPGTYLPL